MPYKYEEYYSKKRGKTVRYPKHTNKYWEKRLKKHAQDPDRRF